MFAQLTDLLEGLSPHLCRYASLSHFDKESSRSEIAAFFHERMFTFGKSSHFSSVEVRVLEPSEFICQLEALDGLCDGKDKKLCNLICRGISLTEPFSTPSKNYHSVIHFAAHHGLERSLLLALRLCTVRHVEFEHIQKLCSYAMLDSLSTTAFATLQLIVVELDLYDDALMKIIRSRFQDLNFAWIRHFNDATNIHLLCDSMIAEDTIFFAIESRA